MYLSSIQIVIQILSIFISFILGYFLKCCLFNEQAIWLKMSQLCYWVLFPALLFYSILSTDLYLNNIDIINYLFVIATGFIIVFVISIILCHRLDFALPMRNAIIQSTGKHNSFMVLILCDGILGEKGYAIATLTAAFQVLFINLFIMSYVFHYTQMNSDNGWSKLLLLQIKNPFLISVILAFIMRALDIHYIPVISESTQLIGRSALPLSLLVTGAELRFIIIKSQQLPLIISIILKMIIFPIIVIGLSSIVDLNIDYLVVAIIYASVPTASSSYIIARATGGDASFLASAIMMQVIVSFFTLIGLTSWLNNQGVL